MLFAKKFREALKQTDLKQNEIAKRLNIDKSNITLYKKGEALPGLDIFYELCKTLDVSADELLGIEESQEYKEPQKKPLEFLSKDEQFIIKSFRKFGQSRKKTILDLIHMSIDSEENSKID